MAAAGLSGTPGQENKQVKRIRLTCLSTVRDLYTQKRYGLKKINKNIFLFQDRERQYPQIGIMVEFAIALIGKLDGINRHSFNNFRLRVGKCSHFNQLGTGHIHIYSALLMQTWSQHDFNTWPLKWADYSVNSNLI